MFGKVSQATSISGPHVGTTGRRGNNNEQGSSKTEVSTSQPLTDKTVHYLNLVEKRRIGLVKPKRYERKLCRQFGTDLRASSNRSFERICRTEDADVRLDRMAVLDDANLVIYDVSPRLGNEERIYERIAEIPLPFANQWVPEAAIPTVRWSPAGSFLSTSGTSKDRNALRILDSATMEVVEQLNLATYGSTAALTHEPSRINPALISIGTSNTEVLISDLRTGNVISSSGTQHKSGVDGIAWSFSDENLLVAKSPREILVWDMRYFTKSSALQLFYDDRDVGGSHFHAYSKFVDNNHVMVMSWHNCIEMYNVYTGLPVRSIRKAQWKQDRKRARFKFGLNMEAGIVYHPVKRNVMGFDLKTGKHVMDARGGHIYPVDMIIFNDYSKELYTLSRHHEAIVWTPFR